ncbi:MAG: NAD-dependent epimerase/dehydratase family protein [Actinomycetota bacterium]
MSLQRSEEAPNVSGTRVVITGGAGFIGSHVVQRLAALGATVTILDDLDPWYSPARKRRNLDELVAIAGVDAIEGDAARTAVDHFGDADIVIHLAGRPGVQDSWGPGFTDSSRRNIELSQTIFEEALAAGVGRVVYASSSSIYGTTATEDGDRIASPVSPYGVSKLAGEQLAGVYRERGLDIVSLRYFTVYGPRQRPDMAMYRMFAACMAGLEDVFVRRGDGLQRREFTYVGDIADATIAAALMPDAANHTFDLGGGSSTDLASVMRRVESITGCDMRMVPRPASEGDPRATVADITDARRVLGWSPRVSLEEGLRAQWAWQSAQAPDDSVIALS